MGFLDDIQQFYRLSESIDRKTMQAAEEMCAIIAGLPIDGEYLNDGSNGGPVIAIVKFSSIINGLWNPAYHLPAEQSKCIRKYLSNFKTAHDIVNAVKKIIENGYVQKNSSSTNDRTYLNKNTMKAIKNSDLGKYASTFVERSWVVCDDRDMWFVCKTTTRRRNC